jgi:hypothetical protein
MNVMRRVPYDDRFVGDDVARPRRLPSVWTKARVIVAVASIMAAAALGFWIALTSHRGGLVFLILPVSLGIVAAAVLTRRTDLVPWGAAGLGVIYMLERGEGDPSVGACALYAAGLLVVLELLFASGDLATGVAWDRGTMLRRWLMFAGLVGVSLSAALVVGMLGSAGRLSGNVLFAVGAVSAVAALISIVRFVRGALR